MSENPNIDPITLSKLETLEEVLIDEVAEDARPTELINDQKVHRKALLCPWLLTLGSVADHCACEQNHMV